MSYDKAAVGELRSFLADIRMMDPLEASFGIHTITWRQKQREAIFTAMQDPGFQEVAFSLATPREISLIIPRWGMYESEHERFWLDMKSVYPHFYALSLLRHGDRYMRKAQHEGCRVTRESLKSFGLEGVEDFTEWFNTIGGLPVEEDSPLSHMVEHDKWYARCARGVWLPLTAMARKWDSDKPFPVYTDREMLRKAQQSRNMKIVKYLQGRGVQ